MGPGDYDLAKAVPPGSDCIGLKTAPSGHLLLPIDKYDGFDHREQQGGLTGDREIVLPIVSNTTSSST